jgi:hypothetical protein
MSRTMPRKPPKKPAMHKHTRAHPGIELDGKGHPIPVADRLPADRAATHRAAPRKRKG